ncbi:hypothetical protein MMC21_000632 [Puttea exsequens]|nr:hypothetical protein [Puttea exsequens]
MPENTSPLEEAPAGAKSHGRQRWREKLWTSSEQKFGRKHESKESTDAEGRWRDKIWASTEGKFGRKTETRESTDDDNVATFLSAGGRRPQAKPQHAALAPRIDTAVATQTSHDAQTTPFEIVDQYRRPRPRQNKGLHVGFVTTAPEIIGEGGDEAELPVKLVSGSYTEASNNSVGTAVPAEDPRITASQGSSRHQLISDDEASFTPPPIRRRPTGQETLNDDSDNDESSNNDIDGSVYSPSPQEDRKPLPQMKLPVDNRRVHAGYDHTKSGYRDVSPVRHEGGHMQRESDTNDGISYGKRPSLDVPTPEIIQNNSVTPGVSPQPTYDRQKSPSPSYFQYTTSTPINAPIPSKQHLQASATPPKEAPSTPLKHSFDEGRQLFREPSPNPPPKAISLQTVAKGIGDDSLADFDMLVHRFNELFRLGVSAHAEMMSIPFTQWIRTAAWWFLKGRTGLETAARNRSSRSNHPAKTSPTTLDQAHINLAKAWWIITDVTPEHPEIRRFGNASMKSLLSMISNFGDQELAELVEVHLSIVANMRALTMSMKRNDMLPHDLEAQRLDLQVLLNLPPAPRAFKGNLINNDYAPPKTNKHFIPEPFFPMPIGDLSRQFNFGRMFSEASFEVHEGDKETSRIPCVLSVLRERKDWGLTAAIASPDGQLSLVIQPAGRRGLTWREIIWKIADRALEIRMFEGFDIRLEFSEKDFRTLWGIWDYTRKVQKDFSPRRDETVIFERDLESFQCVDPGNFPSDSLTDCKLRLFEKGCLAGDRKVHNGFRLTVITPPARKTLSSVNHSLGKAQPVLFNYSRIKDGHRLVLRILPSIKLSPAFRDPPDRELFRSLLCSTHVAKDDNTIGSFSIQSFSTTPQSTDQIADSNFDHSASPAFQFNKIRIAAPHPKTFNTSKKSCPPLSDLRLVAESPISTLVDHIALPPNGLLLALSVSNFNSLTLLLPPQTPKTFSLLDNNEITPSDLTAVSTTLQNMHTTPTTHHYHFHSLPNLHTFQSLLTGFTPLFDAPVASFAISRRRMVAPVHKQWHAERVRLQIVANDEKKQVQLVAFFEDFSHGKCMNFALRVTDVFENFEKGGVFYLCCVDAKFALPRRRQAEGTGDENWEDGFVCLGNPEWPGERDDVTVGFESGQGAFQFRFLG